MTVLNGSLEQIIIVLSLFFIVIIGIIMIKLKDKKEDREEIEELITSIAKAKPREKKEGNKMANIEQLKIEEVLQKMQKDLEASPEEVISSFEQDQEDKSIISYQELLKTMKKEIPKEELLEIPETPTNIDVIDIEDEPDEIEVRQVEPTEDFKEEVKKELIEPKAVKTETKVEEAKPLKDSYQKKEFKNTDIISPIFGKMERVKEEYPKVSLFNRTEKLEELLEEAEQPIRKTRSEKHLEETLDVEPLAEEMRKNDEFLKSLKDFRSNL